MKRLLAFCVSLAFLLFCSPAAAMAAEGPGAETAGPGLLWLCIPFAGLLLCIAVLPLVKPEWWEEHQPHAVALWSVLFAVPFAVMFGAGAALETILECLTPNCWD